MTHDVFISYAYEDKIVADAICAKLESNQIRCWIAPRDIAPGDKYASALINAIDHSPVIVVVFSSQADKSPHVRTEIERAFNDEKIIIPFRIENIEPCDEMQYFIGSRHWLDALTPPLEEHINNLLKVLKKNFEGNTDIKTDVKKIENNLKNSISEEKLVIKTEKWKYCPILYRLASYMIDLFSGSIFGCIFYLICFIVAGQYLGADNLSNLMTVSVGINSRFGDSFLAILFFTGLTLWFILIENFKFLYDGKTILGLTISRSSKKTNVTRWVLMIRGMIKVIPLFIMLLGVIIKYYYEGLGSSILGIGVILQILWAIPILFTSKSQAIHDLIAGTVVCKREK
jgi:uncharacterized RDD family membrane protein YckC